MREQPRVLVVDDEESVVVTIKAILQLDGYDVSTTTSGADARTMVNEQEFDLVLSDLRLEDGDGLDVLRAVRERFPETVTIMLTGYASLESAIQALRVGAYDYLVKPSEVEELRSTVARGIERRRLGLELKSRIVELERANREIAELNSSLQQRIDEATAELKERYEQLKELDRMKSQFLSIASHELKTPITAMSGFLQVALRRVRRMIDGERGQPAGEGLRAVLEQLEVVYRQTGKLARLIDELLDVSRIQTGRIEFRYGDVDLGELADEVATRMQLTTTTHQISVKRENGAVVTADRDHIEQVLNNLVTNAIKYSPSGGPIVIDVGREDGGVRLSVRDKGIGIPSEELESIFGLFYRSPDRAARDQAGMGLGLYISKEIVNRHGGHIWAESGEQGGSTFHVALPRVPIGAAPPASVQPSTA
ncbi:MAG TPA: hybrid sensor histidine kinase/response regulator [Candidatus Limnocylindria bacterium]|jgi:signal transduction histidine kinase|nr:hybrid sensor histidine kinase/response regulator [Candidatus Limnocylindria bacterium]